ncbi:MAG TPA: hypothetical protein DCZ72_12695 [Armatimonadetes bacterium]|nr:hypothetical protein [Armatimonadota bacterium]
MSETQATTASRRRFLSTGLAAGAAALTVDWRSRRAFAQANARVIGANDRINMGFIGLGNMGLAHMGYFVKNADALNVAVTAVCDVFDKRRDLALERTENPAAKAYTDYRELLADPNVDAVLVATPEHWHAQMFMDTMVAGKDLYLEKPLCLHFDDAKRCYDFYQNHTDRVFQLGNQNCSDPKWLRIHELLPTIGTLVWSQNSYCRNTPTGEWNSRIDPDANAQSVNWPLFLGTEYGLAPDRPWDAERFHRWRKYWDYSSGISGDLLAHRIYAFLKAFYGNEAPPLPHRVTANGGNYVQQDGREVPDTFLMTVDYDDHTIFLAGSTENELGVPPVIRGQMGVIEFTAEAGGRITVNPQRPFAEEFDPIVEDAPQVTAALHEPHRDNFIHCVRTRETPNSPMDLAYAGMVPLALADVAYRQSTTVNIDTVTGEWLNRPATTK